MTIRMTDDGPVRQCPRCGQDVAPTFNAMTAHDRVCEGSPVIDGQAVVVGKIAAHAIEPAKIATLDEWPPELAAQLLATRDTLDLWLSRPHRGRRAEIRWMIGELEARGLPVPPEARAELAEAGLVERLVDFVRARL